MRRSAWRGNQADLQRTEARWSEAVPIAPLLVSPAGYLAGDASKLDPALAGSSARWTQACGRTPLPSQERTIMKRALPAALATVLMLPASAAANTQWFYERQPIAVGKTVEIASNGPKVALNLKLPKQTAIKIPCPASGTEAVWNSSTNGLD